MSVDQSYGLELGVEVQDAAQAFAAALNAASACQAFERAAATLRDDVVARCAIDAYQQRAQSLRALLTLSVLSAEEQADLDRLRRAYEEEPSVVAYLAAALRSSPPFTETLARKPTPFTAGMKRLNALQCGKRNAILTPSNT